jgi:uncharacterized protein (TIGR04255 family)
VRYSCADEDWQSNLAMAQLYKRPPIVEAVIEIRTEGDLPRETVDKVKRRLLPGYPFSTEAQIVNVEIGGANPKLAQHFQGHRLTSKDGTGVVTITQKSISTSRLAPYEGWENMVCTARENWLSWKKVVGYRKVSRIGIRFINRVDIPNREEKPIRIDDYLTFRPEVPNIGLAPMRAFNMNASMDIGRDGFKVTLITSLVPSPLVKTLSLLLDIDLSREADLPQNDDDLWSLVNVGRAHKNLVFEGCITDATRRLFS